jgi:hypothetical protein
MQRNWLMPFYRLPEGEADPASYVHINFGGRRNRTAPPPCREKRAAIAWALL